MVLTAGRENSAEPEPEEPLPAESLGTSLERIHGGGTFQWWWPQYVWAADGTEIF